MATNMKAAFTLTLEDKLSSGLNAIKQGFDRLKQVGGQLNLGKLGQEGGDLLRTIGREARNLTSNLEGISAAADRGWVAMKRMASTRFGNVEKQLFGQNGFRGPGHEVAQRGQLGVIGGALAGYSIYKPATDYATFENNARHSAITQGLVGAAVDLEAKRLMSVFKKDALKTGQSSMSIGQAYQDLIQTGIDPAKAELNLPTHSMAATAYNISAESMGHTVGALMQNMKIDEHELPGALASMALASKSGRFKVEDFNHFLPSITGDLSKLGMTGRGGADYAFAALEIAMKNAGDPGSGAANFRSFMNHILAPSTAQAFSLQGRLPKVTQSLIDRYHIQGIDLPRLLEAGRKKGVDPVTNVLRAIQAKVRGLPTDVQGEVIGAFLHEQESRDFAQSMVAHSGEFLALMQHLRTANTSLLGSDFGSAAAAPLITLHKGEEAATQIERRAGEGFQPIVDKLSGGLQSIATGIDTLDQKFPGLTDATLAVTGSLLTLAAGLAAIGFVAPAVSAGASLLAGAVSSAITVALPFALTALPVALPLALPAIAKIGSDAETPENRAALDQLARERQSLQGGPQGDTSDGFGPDGRPIGLGAGADDSSAKADPHRLDIHVHADPGTRAEVTHASPGIFFTIPNPGRVTGQP